MVSGINIDSTSVLAQALGEGPTEVEEQTWRKEKANGRRAQRKKDSVDQAQSLLYPEGNGLEQPGTNPGFASSA